MRSIMSCLMLSGSGLLPDDAVNHGGDFTLTKPIEIECSNIRSSNPRRIELWSVLDDQQHTKRSSSGPQSDPMLQGSWDRAQCASSKIIRTGL